MKLQAQFAKKTHSKIITDTLNVELMYKDIITYELAENVTTEHLMDVAKKIVTDWMAHQEGFVKWEIHTNKNGSYTDIVYWQSEENAKLAEKSMATMPHAGDWFACYKEGSITSQNISKLASFPE